jgi:hypothetical protein
VKRMTESVSNEPRNTPASPGMGQSAEPAPPRTTAKKMSDQNNPATFWVALGILATLPAVAGVILKEIFKRRKDKERRRHPRQWQPETEGAEIYYPIIG